MTSLRPGRRLGVGARRGGAALSARRGPDGGCLVVLEDLHWADSETLTIVEYLADNLAAEHVLCIATVRDEGTSAGLDLARTLEGAAGIGADRAAIASTTPRWPRCSRSCLGARRPPRADGFGGPGRGRAVPRRGAAGRSGRVGRARRTTARRGRSRARRTTSSRSRSPTASAAAWPRSATSAGRCCSPRPFSGASFDWKLLPCGHGLGRGHGRRRARMRRSTRKSCR